METTSQMALRCVTTINESLLLLEVELMETLNDSQDTKN